MMWNSRHLSDEGNMNNATFSMPIVILDNTAADEYNYFKIAYTYTIEPGSGTIITHDVSILEYLLRV